MGSITRRTGTGWEGIEPRAYASGAERHVLVGRRAGARQTELRFFRLPAGGSSRLERHAHEHAIVIAEGRGEVRLGSQLHAVSEGDAVFVSAAELHQLHAAADSPLGFFCTAPADRRRGGGA
ncbi:MAG: cupin domain-containing protein [Thermoleophilia bacterium]|nr:cupin domain-containing protein [Thermoleophilia bacterium]